MKKKKILKMMDKGHSFRTISLASFASGGLILAFNYMFLRQLNQIYAIINLLAVAIIIGVPLIYRYENYKIIKKVEQIFPKYLVNITENIATGMTLPQAMRSASSNDYGVLTSYVKAMSSKIDWGIPFENVLAEFAGSTGSKSMKRNVQTIIEAHRSGGKIDTILKSVSQSLQELEHIKKERAASVYAQMINGYMIYILFLGVMIGLSTILVPAFNKFGGVQPGTAESFSQIFKSITIIQGFFAGIAIGKMAEGTIVAGFKHSIALVIFGYSMFLIFG